MLRSLQTSLLRRSPLRIEFSRLLATGKSADGGEASSSAPAAEQPASPSPSQPRSGEKVGLRRQAWAPGSKSEPGMAQTVVPIRPPRSAKKDVRGNADQQPVPRGRVHPMSRKVRERERQARAMSYNDLVESILVGLQPQSLIEGLNMINSEMMAMADKLIREDEIARFEEGRMDDDERQDFMDKVYHVMVREDDEIDALMAQQERIDADPNNRLEEVFSSVRRDDGEVKRPEHVLDAMKEELMKDSGLDEAEFEEIKQQAVEEFDNEVLPKLKGHPSFKQKELDELIQSAEASGVASSVVAKLQVVRNNASWPVNKKVLLAKKMLEAMGPV